MNHEIASLCDRNTIFVNISSTIIITLSRDIAEPQFIDKCTIHTFILTCNIWKELYFKKIILLNLKLYNTT